MAYSKAHGVQHCLQHGPWPISRPMADGKAYSIAPMTYSMAYGMAYSMAHGLWHGL